MSRTQFKMDGLPELEKKLQKIVKNVEPGKVEPLLFTGAQLVTEASRSRAPQGPTGNLKRAHVTKKLKRQGDNPAPSIAAIDRRIAPHAGLIEFGSSRQSAKPYFRPAWDSNRGRAKKIIEDGLKKLIDQGAKG